MALEAFGVVLGVLMEVLRVVLVALVIAFGSVRRFPGGGPGGPGSASGSLKVVLVALVMVAGSFTGGSGLVLVPSRMVLVA